MEYLRTFSISYITTQLSLQYKSTNYATALYIIPRARTVAPVFARILAITPHQLCAFFRFYYTAFQSPLLWTIIRPR